MGLSAKMTPVEPRRPDDSGPARTSNVATQQWTIGRAVLVAVVLALALVLFDVFRTSTNPLNLVQPGRAGPSVHVFEKDFPDSYLPHSTGLDGQQFYVIARNPFDLQGAAPNLDRPRYRLQRPLLSWLAWAGHPTGGGPGLVLSFFVVGTIAVAGLAAAVAAVTRRLGGPVWIAATVGLFPGVWWSLRVTVADTLATALALGAIALLLYGRTRGAVGLACAAILAKETAVLVLVGWVLARPRDRRRWYPLLAALAVGVTWAIVLRVQLPGSEAVGELTVPFSGIVGAVRDRWLDGEELWGLLGFASAVIVAIAGLWRGGVRHPLAPAILVQLAFLSFANSDVLGNDFGSGRAMLPLLTLGAIAVVTPDAGDHLPSATPETVTSSG